MSSVGFAQSSVEETPERRLHIGVKVNTTSFALGYEKGEEKFYGSFVAIPSVHLGYSLSSRTTVQLGAAYGVNTLDHGSLSFGANGEVTESVITSKTKAVTLPVTLRQILLNPEKRLQVFGSASLIPTLGWVEDSRTVRSGGTVTEAYSSGASGFDAFITAGLGLNYRLGARFDLSGEVIVIKSNVNDIGGLTPFKSVVLGIDYRL